MRNKKTTRGGKERRLVDAKKETKTAEIKGRGGNNEAAYVHTQIQIRKNVCGRWGVRRGPSNAKKFFGQPQERWWSASLCRKICNRF